MQYPQGLERRVESQRAYVTKANTFLADANATRLYAARMEYSERLKVIFPVI